MCCPKRASALVARLLMYVANAVIYGTGTVGYCSTEYFAGAPHFPTTLHLESAQDSPYELALNLTAAYLVDHSA